MKHDFMQTLEKNVAFTGRDATTLREMCAWLKTQDFDHKVAALMMMVCVCEELEAMTNTGASNFMFHLVASIYKTHHQVYKINTLALKDIFDHAWAAAELEVKPAANTRPS